MDDIIELFECIRDDKKYDIEKIDKEILLKIIEICFYKCLKPSPHSSMAPYPYKDGFSINIVFKTSEECKIAKDTIFKTINTNFDYPNFIQSIFNAGDEQQFYNHFGTYTKEQENEIIKTFKYMFYKLKKGIFVSIKNNEVNVFLPFNNAEYQNNWSDLLKINTNIKKYEKYKNSKNPIYKFAKDTYSFKRGSNLDVEQDITKWYANNCFFRFEKYKSGNMKDLFEEGSKGDLYLPFLEYLCKEKKIPDCFFFINYRDFPVLKKDFTEPYDLFPKNTKIKDLEEPNVPILSQSITNDYEDILVPTEDDIQRIYPYFIMPAWEPKYTPPPDVPWGKKISKAVFRGSLTGCGITTKTNKRLKAALISYTNSELNLLDAKLVSLNRRLKKDPKSKYIDIVNKNWTYNQVDTKGNDIRTEKKEKVPLENLYDPESRLTNEEFMGYKYILHIEGHVSAFRLSKELSYGSVILKVKSNYKLWFEDKLTAGKTKEAHYIPIKEDLSDLIETIQWCIKHDNICEQIAKNAKKFYKTHLDRDKVLEHFKGLFENFNKKQY